MSHSKAAAWAVGWVLAAAAGLLAPPSWAQAVSEAGLARAAELRADKLPQAAVLANLPAGARLRVLSVEGGWAWVESAGRRGWVRAAALQPGQAVQALGLRSLPPRSNRHALIIGLSRYADAAVSPLPGARIDRESATQMALAMQIPPANIRYLQDEQATGDAIRAALRELNEQSAEGDRIFIHFSGHGTRYHDATAGGCVEALLAYDGGWSGTLTNREMAGLLAPLGAKTDKMFVMYDACHSGGVIAADPVIRSRGVQVPGDEGRLRPKFTPGTEHCGRPVNVKTRNLVVEAVEKGTLVQDIVHLSSSRDNEVSFDDELKGGLATQFMRDCMLRDAVDLDGSGGITIDEIRACAQQKIEKRLENEAQLRPHHLTLNGNAAFIPAWFGKEQLAAAEPPPPAAPPVTSQPAAVPVAPAPSAPAVAAPVPSLPAVQPVASPAAPPVAVALPAPPAPPVAVPPPRLTGQQALRQVFDQRDAKRKVAVKSAQERLAVGRDSLAFSVESDRPGYVYVAMAGSDHESLYVLFPNDLDTDNRIEARRPLALPRASWRLRAAGPAGTDHLIVLVTDAPRDLQPLAAAKVGPFMKSLNDAGGRAELGALLTRARHVGQDCSPAARRREPRACSDAFGAAMFEVEEVVP